MMPEYVKKNDFALFEECIVEPCNAVMEVKECQCQNCGMPIRFPLVIDQEFARFASDILGKICRETGYTAKQIAELSTELYIEIAKQKAKQKKC
jgi:hypothetical protein